MPISALLHKVVASRWYQSPDYQYRLINESQEMGKSKYPLGQVKNKYGSGPLVLHAYAHEKHFFTESFYQLKNIDSALKYTVCERILN